MKMNDLLNFRTGNKYILTNDFECTKILKLWGTSTSFRNSVMILPKGLVFTIVSVKLNNQRQTMNCKIIRSKKIVKQIYEPNNVDPIFYTARSYSGNIDETGFVRFDVSNENFHIFLNTIEADNFTVDYKKITEQE